MINTAPYAALETAWKALISPIITIPTANIYLSDTGVTALHPCLKITTPYCEENQSIGSLSGIFMGKSVLSLEMKASPDQTTPTEADQMFASIVQALYYGSQGNVYDGRLLGARLTATNPTGLTVFSCIAQKVALRTNPMEKLWIKEISFDRVHFMNRANS